MQLAVFQDDLRVVPLDILDELAVDGQRLRVLFQVRVAQGDLVQQFYLLKGVQNCPIWSSAKPGLVRRIA